MKLKPKRLRQVAILPSLFTLGNLLCGFGALTFAIKENFVPAAWLILLAIAVFDGLDGLIARATKSVTKFGAQLDSLADIVSFGIAPAFLSYTIIHQSQKHLISYRFTFLICAFYVVCAALRLARFNVEDSHDFSPHQHFAGLPTPGAAGMIATIIIFQNELSTQYIAYIGKITPLILPVATLLLAFLMVSRLRYIHLFNRVIQSKHPFIRLVEISLVLLLVVFHPEVTLFFGFLLYILSGPILAFISYISAGVKIKAATASREGKDPLPKRPSSTADTEEKKA